jgi:hypothetical protein
MSAHPHGVPSEKDAAILKAIYAPPLSAKDKSFPVAFIIDVSASQRQK